MTLTQRNLHFSPAKLADLEQIMMIERVSFPYPWTEGMVASELCDAPFSFSYVVRNPEENKIIAYVFMRALFDELHLLSVAVESAWRRQGIGDALIALVLKTVHEKGLKRVTLEVRVSNQAAYKLYQKFGFKEVGLRRGYYCKPTENGRVLQYDVMPQSLLKTVDYPSRQIKTHT